MKKFLLAVSLLFVASARADLLDRVHLEAAMQERLRETFKMYDDSAKILVSVELHAYVDALPGVAGGNGGVDVPPDKIELADISIVTVDVFSSLDQVPKEATDALLKAVPVKDKSKIKINVKKFEITNNNNAKMLEVKDFSQIMQKSVESLSLFFGGAVVAGLLLFALLAFFQNSRQLTEFRTQLRSLVEAVNNSESSAPPPPPRATSVKPEGMGQAAPDKVEASAFEHWTKESLKEIFADAYWCGLDGYAHWLWKNISGPQRQSLLSSLRFIKEYCAYFVEVESNAYSFHEHPYYLEPLKLSLISQEDLGAIVTKNLALWQLISPIRKQKLPLSLNEKIQALQAKPAKSFDLPSTASVLRKLDAKPAWGEISQNEEASIFQDPTIVPVEMRHQIRSLVWLAQKDANFIKKTLEKFDARSLASAWVGPAEMLKNLEDSLPEKKLKLVLNYKTKVDPNRQSEIYQLLVDEGLKDEAA